jgi:hypothetical protein
MCAVGHGAVSGDLVTTAIRPLMLDVGASQRAVHEAEDVVGRQRFDRPGRSRRHSLHAQPARANVLARVAFVDAFILDIARCQVDPGNAIGETTDHMTLLFVQYGFVQYGFVLQERDQFTDQLNL